MVILPQQFALQFMLAGKSYFTIKNSRTGKFVHYSIIKSEKYTNYYFVSYKPNAITESEGADKKNGWKYLCAFVDNGLRPTAKSPADVAKSPEFIALDWTMHKLVLNDLPSHVTMYRHVWCGCCGMKLTDEHSVLDGLGPTCYERVTGNKRSRKKSVLEALRNSQGK